MSLELINIPARREDTYLWVGGRKVLTFVPDPDTVSLQDLYTFEFDATNYLYNLPPKQNNLFWAGQFMSPVRDSNYNLVDGNFTTRESSASDNGVLKKTDVEGYNKLHNAQFRIRSIRFGTTQLQYKESKAMQTDFISGVELNRNITIEWEEDAYRSLQVYHMNWMKAWYNREGDYFVTGHEIAKLRNLQIVGFQYVNKNIVEGTRNRTSMTVPFPEPIFKITLVGLKPVTAGDFNFSYTSSGNEEALSLTYKTTSVLFAINKELVDNLDMIYQSYAENGKVFPVNAYDIANNLLSIMDSGGLIL